MNSRMMVAVDAGNSSIKLAMMEGSQAVDLSKFAAHRIGLASEHFESQLAAFARSLPPTDSSVLWLIASVNSKAVDRLRHWINRDRARDTIRFIDRQQIGITADVRFPERVGIDRLLGAKAAYELAGSRSALIIDAGTSITVDLVDDSGVFRGGAILPGIGLQLRSLHEATDRLPLLPPPQSFAELESPGRDTHAAMYLGVAAGITGAVDRLVESFLKQCPDATIYLTGGDAMLIADALRWRPIVVADLPVYALFAVGHRIAIEA